VGDKPSTRELLKAYKECSRQGLSGEEFMACLARAVRDRGQG
jgi:hypothetical protein